MVILHWEVEKITQEDVSRSAFIVPRSDLQVLTLPSNSE
jgi:hypothetical protein